MRKMFFSILAQLLMVMISHTSHAQNASKAIEYPLEMFPGVTADLAKELSDKGRIDRFPTGADDFLLLPVSGPGKYISAETGEKSFNTAVESLFFLPCKPKNTSSSPGNPSDVKQVTLALSNSLKILTKIETLSGIKYYSVTHKKERVLFENAEIISGHDGINSFLTSAPDILQGEFSVQALIDDTTFGENSYVVDYNVDTGSIVMKMSNKNTLSLGFLPVTGKGNLVFYLAVIPSDEGIFLYCCGLSKTINSDFIRKRIGQSVYNRITALFNWFSTGYTKTYLSG